LQLVKDLGIKREQASEINKLGSPSGLQPKVVDCAAPLKRMCDEMRRVVKFTRTVVHKSTRLSKSLCPAGSASMPGFLEYMTAQINIPVVVARPWDGLDLKHLDKVTEFDAPMYTTAIGLARLEGSL
jgi:Tfp pilus assembly PilM family ATPase